LNPPLAGLRIVATMPPWQFFGGVDFNFAVEMVAELRELGATILELDVGGFCTKNQAYIGDAVERVRSFRPDVAVSLPNAGYVLYCVTTEGHNVFADVLQIPVVMLWDHGLYQFPKMVLDPLPGSVAESSRGCIQRLRQALNHPLFFHYSPDRGHVAALEKMGVIDGKKVRFFLQPAYPNFVRYGYRGGIGDAFRTRISFAGNVYLEASQSLPSRRHQALAGMESAVLSLKKDCLTIPLWDLFEKQIQSLDRSSRKALSLDPDSSFFWRFLHDVVELAGNTDVRLHVLSALKRDFDFFGNFIEPGAIGTLKSRHRMRYRKSLDYFTELPLLFMNSEVVVDVINLGYNTGISPKVMGCLACGGLVLFDYKDDFFQSMGDLGNQIMYRSVDHLNTLIDDYLGDPRKRRETSRYLQSRVCTEFHFGALAKRIFADEPVWRN
jgi:hypothetical protein